MTTNEPKRSGEASLEARLRRFAADHGIPLAAEQRHQLARLDGLVTEWGRVVDLSGFREDEERVDRYFLEPLAASRWLPERPGEALDVGSGGGSPALPLAVLHREQRWTLLEPNRRRAVFLEEASSLLGLDELRVRRVRLRDYAPERTFVAISSRGVSVDETSLQRMGTWLEPGGRLLLFTGRARSEALVGWRGSLREAARLALPPALRGWLLVLEKP